MNFEVYFDLICSVIDLFLVPFYSDDEFDNDADILEGLC